MVQIFAQEHLQNQTDINRIIFTREGDVVGFVIVGNHKEIRRFLKNV